jgi:hypothetical protein
MVRDGDDESTVTANEAEAARFMVGPAEVETAGWTELPDCTPVTEPLL